MSELFNFAKNVPEWMNQSYFEKVVRQLEKDPKAEVTDFSVAAGSKPGDNFASSIFRAKISYKSKYTKEVKTISTIVKTQMIQGLAEIHDLLKDAPFFRNEMEMFGKVLPEIQALWLSVGDKSPLCPKLIYQSIEPCPTIILEDLSVHGFDVIDKPPQDFELSKRIFTRLAKFHAATFQLHQEQKLDYSDFTMNLFQNPVMVKMMITDGINAFIDVAKEAEEFERFIPNLESFTETFTSKCLKTYTANRNEFGYNVLNHADFHLKNLLFKKTDSGAVEDFYFLDYQLSIHATPAIDLIYALYFHVSSENRQKHRAELIGLYHKQFVESLKAFGYLKAPPTLIDLQVELLKNGHLEVIVAICMMIMFYFDFSSFTAEDMDMGEGTKRAKRRMYSAPGFKEIILAELPRFLHNGFI